MRRLVALIGLCVIAASANAADTTPVRIGAFSSPALASEGFYQDFGRSLSEAETEPFDVTLLVHGELGSDEAHFYALRRGRLDIAGVGMQSVTTMLPELAVLNAAYLFASWDEFDSVLETAVVPYMNDLLAENGVVGLRHFGAAWHGVYTKRPARTPGELSGARFRALIDPASQLFAQALDVDLFQIPSTEILTALQTGLIDAGETNSHVYNMTGTSEAAPYYTRTRHTASVVSIIANKRWFDGLSTGQQELVRAAYPPMREAGAALRADEERMLADAAASHVTIIEPDSAELQRWRDAGQSTHRALVDQIGGNALAFYDLIVEAKAAYTAASADSAR